MIATVVPFVLVFIATLVVYALVRKIILERRLAAMIRRQPHIRQREEDAEFFEEVKRDAVSSISLRRQRN
jgi:hypothetical protein